MNICEKYAEFECKVDETLKVKNYFLYDCGDSTFAQAYKNVSLKDFESLRDEIKKSSGFKTVTDREIRGNLFLYGNTDYGYTGISYIPCRNEIRTVVCKGGELKSPHLADKSDYGCKKRIIQLCPDDNYGNFGMAYVICLGEGHFIMYDGNGDLGGMADKIFNTLKENTPKGQKPVIEAWFITHIHWDHVSAMSEFSKKYSERVEVKNILANFPDRRTFSEYDITANIKFFEIWWPQINASFKNANFHKVHTGQEFFVGDVRVEILLTHEDIFPMNLRTNDTSVVTQMYIDGKKIFFPGDITEECPCKRIHDMYLDYLKSDIYQVAHHGWETFALYFYDDVDASTVFWPLRKRDWQRIQKYPQTKRIAEERAANKRKFLISVDDDISVEL